MGWIVGAADWEEEQQCAFMLIVPPIAAAAESWGNSGELLLVGRRNCNVRSVLIAGNALVAVVELLWGR